MRSTAQSSFGSESERAMRVGMMPPKPWLDEEEEGRRRKEWRRAQRREALLERFWARSREEKAVKREEKEEPRKTRKKRRQNTNKQKVCMECTKKCLKTHGKNASSSSFSPPFTTTTTTPLSFFKIMLGDFTESLFIPPKFASTLGGLIGKNIYLQDSSGQRWRVKIALVHGSLAFAHGWSNFVLDHVVKVGELLVFKYISRTVISAQIFATSACERLHFCETNKKVSHKRKRIDMVFPDNLYSNKVHNNSEASEVKRCSVDEDSLIKERITGPVPCDSSGIIIAASNCMANGVGVDVNPSDRSCHDNSSGRLQTGSTVKNTEAMCLLNAENFTRMLEAGKGSPDNLSNFRPKGASIVDCAEARTKNQCESSWGIITQPLTEGKLFAIEFSEEKNVADKDQMGEVGRIKTHAVDLIEPGIIDGKIDAEKIHGNSFSVSQAPNTNNTANEGGKLGTSKEFLCKDHTEGGICHDVDEDLTNKLGLSEHALFDDNEKHSTISQAEKSAITIKYGSLHENNLKEPVNALIMNSTKDETKNLRPLPEDTHSGGKMDIPPGAVGSASQSMTDSPFCHKDPDVMKGNTGMVLHSFGEVNEKNFTAYSEGKSLKVVKTEIMDPVVLPTLNYGNLTFSLPVNDRSWLELPERLPFRLGRKRHERKVVILQDPCMRLWPVLYHESLKFVGFTGGWEDFSKANKLQPGDICEFEFHEEPETAFHVRIFRS